MTDEPTKDSSAPAVAVVAVIILVAIAFLVASILVGSVVG